MVQVVLPVHTNEYVGTSAFPISFCFNVSRLIGFNCNLVIPGGPFHSHTVSQNLGGTNSISQALETEEGALRSCTGSKDRSWWQYKVFFLSLRCLNVKEMLNILGRILKFDFVLLGSAFFLFFVQFGFCFVSCLQNTNGCYTLGHPAPIWLPSKCSDLHMWKSFVGHQVWEGCLYFSLFSG